MLTVGFSRVRNLSIVLEDVNIVSPQRDLTDKQKKELCSITGACHDVLSTLNKTLDNYQDLGSNSQNGNSKSFGFKARKTWKRFKWEPEDIKELRNRIISNISLLGAFHDILMMYSPLLLYLCVS